MGERLTEQPQRLVLGAFAEQKLDACQGGIRMAWLLGQNPFEMLDGCSHLVRVARLRCPGNPGADRQRTQRLAPADERRGCLLGQIDGHSPGRAIQLGGHRSQQGVAASDRHLGIEGIRANTFELVEPAECGRRPIQSKLGQRQARQHCGIVGRQILGQQEACAGTGGVAHRELSLGLAEYCLVRRRRLAGAGDSHGGQQQRMCAPSRAPAGCAAPHRRSMPRPPVCGKAYSRFGSLPSP